MFFHKIYKYILDFCIKIFFLSKYGIKNKKYFRGLKFIFFFIYFELIRIVFIKFFYDKRTEAAKKYAETGYTGDEQDTNDKRSRDNSKSSKTTKKPRKQRK